ncbi:hypothetical protein A9Q95_15620 [Rhodobacterales bacterium 59_46_T64]|nr:hypothetical protein A9Q95_15620 [Rhodobacterales bacterium 59_46_T64]
MAQKLILHLPIHKTGSTALQKTLVANETLLNKQNMTYLPQHTKASQHFHLSEFRGDELQKYLAKMRTGARGKDLILSSEKLHLLSTPDLQDFFTTVASVFDGFAITVVVYLRRQDDAINSLYSQLVKYGTLTASSKQFFDRRKHAFDYEHYLEVISGNVPEDTELMVRVYDRSQLRDGDIVEDFAHLVGITGKLKRGQKDANHSLEKSVFKIKRAMNSELQGAPPDLLQSMAGILADASKNMNNGKPDTNVLSDLERSLIMEFYAESNARISEKYLGGETFSNSTPKTLDYESSFEVVFPLIMARMSRYFHWVSTRQ